MRTTFKKNTKINGIELNTENFTLLYLWQCIQLGHTHRVAGLRINKLNKTGFILITLK